MLTAYNYYDPEEEDRVRTGIKSNRFFQEELAIASRFSMMHAPQGVSKPHCWVCGSDENRPFFQKWGVQYYYCDHCYSVQAGVLSEDVAAYRRLEDMRALRISVDYQEEGASHRAGRWEELLDWLRFRVYRYCGRNRGLSILDYGNRWQALRQKLQESDLCGEYVSKNSILDSSDKSPDRPVDLVLALDYLQQINQPKAFFQEVHDALTPRGIFVLSTKVGSGLDVLLLKGNNHNVFPYEHIFLPSKEGIKILLRDAGMELLEFTTPGTFDINYVKANQDGIDRGYFFIRYFLATASPSVQAEFQRFIQKAGMSSYAQIVARRLDA